MIRAGFWATVCGGQIKSSKLQQSHRQLTAASTCTQRSKHSACRDLWNDLCNRVGNPRTGQVSYRGILPLTKTPNGTNSMFYRMRLERNMYYQGMRAAFFLGGE